MADAAKALVAAQREMGKAFKGATNPHFKSNYASLGAVMEACYPALHAHGFAVLQPQGRDDHGDFVETVFLHESGEMYSSRVYLLLQKQDMQGKGSAITYARRYGLIALAGLSDTDDDAEAACAGVAEANEAKAAEQHAKFEREVFAKIRMVEDMMEAPDTAAAGQEFKAFWAGLVADSPDVAREVKSRGAFAAAVNHFRPKQEDAE